MEYFAALQMFVMKVLFNKNEYSFTSKEFKPVRLIVIIALVLNLWFSIYLLTTIHRVQVKIQKECPAMFEKITL